MYKHNDTNTKVASRTDDRGYNYHRFGNHATSTPFDPVKDVLDGMRYIVSRNEIKQPATDEEFEKVTSGTIIWAVTAEKTTNSRVGACRLNAKSGKADYFPTPDGFCCLKPAPWIVETVNEESRSYACKRMTRHSNSGNARLTPSQQVQTMRVLYPDGRNNSNDLGLPVVKVAYCIDNRVGEHISLISMKKSKTIRATQGIVIYGVLEPQSTMYFLRKSLQVNSDKTKFTLSNFQSGHNASPYAGFVANKAIQSSDDSGIGDELSSSSGSYIPVSGFQKGRMIDTAYTSDALEDLEVEVSPSAIVVYKGLMASTPSRPPTTALSNGLDDHMSDQREVTAFGRRPREPEIIGSTILAKLEGSFQVAYSRMAIAESGVNTVCVKFAEHREKFRNMDQIAITHAHHLEYRTLLQELRHFEQSLRSHYRDWQLCESHKVVARQIFQNPPEHCKWNVIVPNEG
ncbi:hypothetical protein GT037_006461 [Alternaria burnsii]|uniref:Uncharacterized protein n=1 Tax=Alternaria burnsii TaxID=1187904 RepID=A0A8H7B5J6_9PLEO|nr:uncharacterized protein GT037_006461 [Alternaria burnsii]KAF7675742.1 hypothetical protein GT037_006461 [Alternaria burnsii]CAI9626392.1 unnamed protein product [Alternaria burnsii]